MEGSNQLTRVGGSKACPNSYCSAVPSEENEEFGLGTGGTNPTPKTPTSASRGPKLVTL